jgi:flagellar motor switch protein FliN/FliY
MTQTNVNEIELSEVDQPVDANAKTAMDPQDISLIQDLPISLNVQVGDVQLSVQELYALKIGQVVKLDTQVSQPVTLKFNDQAVAAGVLVAVDDHYGVEITSIASIKA